MDIPSWCNITLVVTTCLDLYLGLGLLHIEEQESKNENTALNDVRVDIDEERRPLVQQNENFEANVENNKLEMTSWMHTVKKVIFGVFFRYLGIEKENQHNLSEKDKDLLKTERIKFETIIELCQTNGFSEDLVKLLRNVGYEPGKKIS